ncbi:MAG: archaeal heat shock protein Hsp20 [Candidatus Nitrosocosmicus sp.]
MSNRDIQPYEWFKRFFGTESGRDFFSSRDVFREFDDMQREMQRMYDQFTDIQSNAPKELIREYETKEGNKVREVGPIVYGYSMTIGPDGKPHVQEFGNVKPFGSSSSNRGGFSSTSRFGTRPEITAEREPLADVNVTDNEVKVVLEMPGVKKESIKVNAYDGKIEVLSNDPQRKYHKTIEIPQEIDIESAKSSYNNGILEVTFNKKKEAKPKGKEVKVE